MERRTPSGREKDEAAVKFISQLRGKLYSDDSSNARRAAFSFSWLQEDGLDVLKEALFGESSVKTKNAAAYGLRSMRGRMKKMALEVLEEGTKHSKNAVRETCIRALTMLSQKTKKKPTSQKRAKPAPKKPARIRITEITARKRKKVRVSNERREQLPVNQRRSRK